MERITIGRLNGIKCLFFLTDETDAADSRRRQNPPSRFMPAVTDAASDYEYIIDLVYNRCRIRLHEGKQPLIKARLGKRLRHHGFESLAQYCNYLRQGRDPDEITHLVDALTTNYTQFLREKVHFEFLVKTALPSLVSASPGPFAVWSAACATGEEPYSLAFYLSEYYPPGAGWDWRILATDISTKALAAAQSGIYPADRLNSVPPDWWKKYFQKGVGEWEGQCRIKADLSRRIGFRQINLLGTYDFQEQFEIIFCRNVMIYFDRPTQEQLVRKLSQHLRPAGYLLIGHSESLNGLDLGLRCLRPSIYQKV
jgi:chemotaxis protein methyltransferase CheR